MKDESIMVPLRALDSTVRVEERPRADAALPRGLVFNLLALPLYSPPLVRVLSPRSQVPKRRQRERCAVRESEAMDMYDIFMLVVLAGATLFGAWKGVAWQLASLASLVASYLVALRWSEPSPIFRRRALCLEPVRGDAGLYAACSLVIWSLFRLVSTWINRVQLRDFDHQLGAVLGAAKGVLWCVVITFFAITLVGPGPGENPALAVGLLHRGAVGSGRRGDAQGAARSARSVPAQARKGTGSGQPRSRRKSAVWRPPLARRPDSDRRTAEVRS